ncbi:phospholipase D family protein [Pseudomonas alliivorans]|nr:phospholipase D family protein [Pseudomonas alliivorans]MEE4701271.1 phospholipase D family protein [Pseudomonas alliivorans]MEE4737195.1 phospholipase D family protein [Pseudomonas alliivorans]
MERTTFLSDTNEILHTIKRLILDAEDGYGIAVAFWGKGAEILIPNHGYGRIICNLGHPGTNPHVIEKIRSNANVSVRYLDSLHAKVVVSDQGSFVGSSNLSEAALGITTPNGEWQEAGVFLEPSNMAAKKAWRWFEALWEIASPVGDVDIAEAAARWEGEALSESHYRKSGPLADLKLKGEMEAATTYRLHELQLFAQRLENSFQSDVMTMASHSFQELYDDLMGIPARQHGDPQSTGPNRKAAGQAANVLWAQSGSEPLARLKTPKGTIQVNDPKMFLKRSAASGLSDRVWEFLNKLAAQSRGDGNDAYRYWAGEVVSKHNIV